VDLDATGALLSHQALAGVRHLLDVGPNIVVKSGHYRERANT
jgi:hypothetical protein